MLSFSADPINEYSITEADREKTGTNEMSLSFTSFLSGCFQEGISPKLFLSSWLNQGKES